MSRCKQSLLLQDGFFFLRYALCALRFALSCLTLNGSLSKIAGYDKYTLLYSKVRMRE
jgi:hypothetical protein